MNVYDQSARFAVKSDPGGFFRWLLPGLPAELSFQGWLDARTLGFPGEPDRVCDTVAEIFDPNQPSKRWALATEFQAEPDRDILDRLLEYLARLRRELRHGPRRLDKFRVAAALVHLTGRAAPSVLDMSLPGQRPVGLTLTIASRALRAEDAARTLAEIAEGRTTRWLLPWIPLMKGATKPTMREEWLRLATLEPDPRVRDNLATLALIFAGLTRDLALWKQSLEGWNVKESMVVAEWKAEWKAEGKAEGKAEAERESLLRLLRLRFPGSVEPEVMARINAESDLTRLAEWFTVAVTADSYRSFRASTQL